MTRPQAIATARRMVEGGWAIEHVRRYLAGHGHRVSWSQVKDWVDPEYRERRLERERERQRKLWRDRHGVRPENYRVFSRAEYDALLLALRLEDGLSFSAIAAVSRRILGQDVTVDVIRQRLYALGVEKNPNKVRAAERGNALRSAAA